MEKRPLFGKRWLFLCGIIALIAIILLFPVTTTRVISGDGQVLTMDKEKLGNCELSIEIKEVNARIFSYGKDFSFVLDGKNFSEFADDNSHTETEDGLCLISQMYYDEEENRMGLCSLVYQKDLSYAVIRWNEKLYFVNPGLSIPFSEIPIA